MNCEDPKEGIQLCYDAHNQTEALLIKTSLLRSFIVSCFVLFDYFQIQFLPKDCLLHGTSIFRYRWLVSRFYVNTSVLLQTCTSLVLPADCPEDSSSSTVVIFDNFLLSFFKGSNNSLFLFPEIGNKYSSIFDVVTHKAWVCHQVNAFKFSRMVHYNHRSLMILVNDAKYIYLPIFSASSIEPLSYCKYKTFINSSAYFTTNFY